MDKTAYLAELRNPHLEISDVNDETRTSLDIDDYLKRLDELRDGFIELLSSCREATAFAFIDELERVDMIVTRRIQGVFSTGLPEAIVSNDRLKNKVLRGMKSSVDRTIDFARLNLRDYVTPPLKMETTSITMAEVKPDAQQPDAAQQKNMEVISGTSGLAKFLGCGKTKAFAIISSGKLEKLGIQYKVGNCWKFNARKLKKYLADNPKFLE